ncbi:hypothetical protein WAX74_07570 [Psychrobacillus sp. FJAT-51614]|uniref:Uncharacterized protein n=1 Tax=Psychrobacillus mangrovi TaxID=3117745 RepID=A0ABU8F3F0_9BACI
MESIIVIIIMAIISSLVGKKKKTDQKPVKQTQQQMKPVKDNPFKDLGDFAKDFMDEQKKQLNRKSPEVKKAPIPVERVEREVMRDQGKPRSTGRLSVHQEKKEKKVSQPNINVIPNSKDDLVKAIVFSEILAPPKSRR